MRPLAPSALTLPPCPLPRPGEAVRWFAEARAMTGTLQGHNTVGDAVIQTQFGTGTTKPFEEIRVDRPFERLQPNWHSLPHQGKILEPTTEIRDRFRSLLAQRIPPGPSYRDLINETWGRGFEIFVVGGTVRDVLVGEPTNDIDLVTTMPLNRIRHFLKSMYRTNNQGNDLRGFIRLGGTPNSGDPFIDLKIFSDSLPGTRDAVFGVGFERDARHRDFACNAIYYDAVNEAIIDPTGHGVPDCAAKQLDLVCQTGDHYQMAQIFIRAVKFQKRGYQLTSDSYARMIQEFLPCLGGMRADLRHGYFITQVTSKLSAAAAKREAVIHFKTTLGNWGLMHIWEQYFGADMEGMFSDD